MRWNLLDTVTIGAVTLAGFSLRAHYSKPDLKTFDLYASSCGEFKAVSTSPNVEMKGFKNAWTEDETNPKGISTLHFTLDEQGEGYVNVIDRRSDEKSILYSYHLRGGVSLDPSTQCCNPDAFENVSVDIISYDPVVGRYDDLVENKAWSTDTAPTIADRSKDKSEVVSRRISEKNGDDPNA